jgi:drug/metabolite transporter (DMT)-like permease
MIKDSDFQTKYAPHAALLAVQMFFGASAVLGKAALQSFPALAIVGFRVAGGAAAFCILQQLKGGLRLEKVSHYWQFGLFSLFGVIFNHLLFFKGLSLTTAANTSLLSVMIPIFTIIISVALGNERLTLRKVLGVSLATVGVIYLIDPAKASFSSETTVGNLMIILNSLSYAVYIVISKKLVSYYGALKSIAWVFLLGAVVNFPIGLYSLQSVDLGAVSWKGWAATLGVVLFPTILAYYWNAWALMRVTPSVVAVYTYLQPLIGFFLAVVFLGVQWTTRFLAAMLLIFAGVFLVN